MRAPLRRIRRPSHRTTSVLVVSLKTAISLFLKHAFPFSESCRNPSLISYADLHRRGNERPTYHNRWFELPDFPIVFQRRTALPSLTLMWSRRAIHAVSP